MFHLRPPSPCFRFLFFPCAAETRPFLNNHVFSQGVLLHTRQTSSLATAHATHVSASLPSFLPSPPCTAPLPHPPTPCCARCQSLGVVTVKRYRAGFSLSVGDLANNFTRQGERSGRKDGRGGEGHVVIPLCSVHCVSGVLVGHSRRGACLAMRSRGAVLPIGGCLLSAPRLY